jgi:hypothetical protein
MHLEPTAGCQISTLIFGFGRETPFISPKKLSKNGKVLCHSGLNSNVLPGPLTTIHLN